MSLGAAFYIDGAHRSAHRALEFLADPHADAEKYMESVDAGRRTSGDTYPYALGVAMAVIQDLLNAAGFCEQGPDRFDCEWSVTHPYEDDELVTA